MSSFNLDVFFRPRNVTLVGASQREGEHWLRYRPQPD